MSSMPTQGRVGNTGARKTVVSFPGREVECWNRLVGGNTRLNLNWAVVYDTTVPEDEELARLIKETTWETDAAEWEHLLSLLERSPWFQQWVANVRADSDKEDFLVISDRDGNFGNYQRAETKWLAEEGFSLKWANSLHVLTQEQSGRCSLID